MWYTDHVAATAGRSPVLDGIPVRTHSLISVATRQAIVNLAPEAAQTHDQPGSPVMFA
jgi:hypothetical protein